MGLTETEAKEQGVPYEKGDVPVGRVRPRAVARPLGGLDEAADRPRDAARCSAPGWSASTPAS